MITVTIDSTKSGKSSGKARYILAKLGDVVLARRRLPQDTIEAAEKINTFVAKFANKTPFYKKIVDAVPSHLL